MIRIKKVKFMAVIQLMFQHRRRGKCGNARVGVKDGIGEDFTYQLRRMVLSEANAWSDEQGVLLEWGDPAHEPNIESILRGIRQNTPKPLFGRSWIYYHRATHRLTLAQDRLGLFPMLLAQTAEGTCVASDALAMSQLLGERARPDSGALVELLAYGQLLGSRSTLEKVLHLPAAALMELSANGHCHLCHTLPHEFSEHTTNEKHALEVLIAAVDRRLRADPDSLLLLSADPESALLMAVAQAAGHRPDVLSLYPPGDARLDYVAELADHTGAWLHGPGPWWDARGEQNIPEFSPSPAQFGAGEVPLSLAGALFDSEFLAHTRGATLLTTTGAGAYRGFFYQGNLSGYELLSRTSLKKALPQRASHYVKAGFAPLFQMVCQALPALRELLCEHLEQNLSGYQGQAPDAAHYLDAVYLGERMRRAEIATVQLLARDYARTHPFLDPEVNRVLSALPPCLRANGQFYRNALHALNPQLAARMARAAPKSLPNLPEGHASPVGLKRSHASSTEQWAMLNHALRACALPEPDIRQGLNALFHGPNAPYVNNVTETFSSWWKYLRSEGRGQRTAM